MSRLGEKIDQVTARGEASRATWTPEIGSAPLRVYNWWCRKTNTWVEQENFCHFWRVVLIWAPLLAVGRCISRYGFYVFVTVLWAGMLSVATVFQWQYIGAWSLLAVPGELLGIVLVLLAGLFTRDFLFGYESWSLGEVLRKRRHRKLNKMAKQDPTPPSAAKEFVVLIGQVIRVKKWKICPLVEIPSDDLV